MRILLMATAYNGLTQRAHRELTALGHEVSVELSLSDEAMRQAALLFKPSLIICPFLKDRIPDDIWENHTCIIIHPGIKGDRGPSSMDWAMMEDVEEWGVTALQAAAIMDTGDIWASRTFKRRPVDKARMYRYEIMEAGMEVIMDTIKRFSTGIYFPETLDYGNPDVKGKLRPPMTQKDRRIDWKRDGVDTIIRKVYSADNQPGVLDTLLDEEYYLYGIHREGRLLGDPGQIIAKRQDAICIAAIDGAVWISHLRKRDAEGERYFKLPATRVLADKLKDVPERPLDVLYKGGIKESFFDAICLGSADTYNEIWYHEENDVGYLAFDFYNGAMDTEKCYRLRDTFLAARKRPTKVIVLSCGMDFWSNGIHLGVIEAAEDPAREAWRNINAIDDLVYEIITTDTHLVVSAMLGSAAAGGLIMALAADRIYAHHGIILNPHYKTMGLYGSEYWTYLLPRWVGQEKAMDLTENCLPITVEEAHDILSIDGIIYNDGYDFYRHVALLAEQLARAPDYDMQIRLKAEQRRLDEEKKPLTAYREEELAEMKKCLYDPNHIYPQCGVDFHTARRNFVHKIRPAATPLRLARHRVVDG
uniref:Methionyl-tRNA formyltransferase n=1 Tax=Candidatus Kentrum sp. LFY TaxID=2126342 RepID=A0A450U8W0_9GAMM|nr:MAG: Methionyl-tRNA formyltransferase [Candidatus Kentron sp. LFY]